MNTQWGKDSLFNKWCWENWITTCRKMKLNPYLTPLTKINMKWIEDINIRSDTIKHLEENTGKKFLNISLGDAFLDLTPKVQKTVRAKINK